MEAPQRSVDEMLAYIREFSLDGGVHGDQGYQRVLLQLFGPVGSGKSMLINSCKYVLEGGEYVMHVSDEQTAVRKTFQLTPIITIADNRGTGHLIYHRDIPTLYAQLGSFLPLDERVDRLYEYEDLVEKVEKTDLAPNYSDLTVPVLVHSGSLYPYEEASEINALLRGCTTMTGISPIVIITRKNNPNAAEIERQFHLAGAEQVLLVENYTREDHLRTLGRDHAVLTFLYNALQDVTFRMSERRDVIKERTERKKFLIKYMHQTVLEREIQKLRP
ncbi:uncharacterized protein ACNLHF_026685 [Anomaloglossus baeobatrachus]|uniref:uncharacterized protein LOC142246563 n=1 Tax=Anomaloglossus baeobatrachus TaxID=238106 RepID=UPI003F4F54D2